MSRLAIPVGAEDHLQGVSTARWSLVEYGDYQCPSCGQAYPVVRDLQDHFGDNLSLVFRHFPLSTVHPWAAPAAEVAEFAAAQGRFWKMHDLLFENQDGLGEALFVELSEALGLSAQQLLSAVNGRTYRARIQADFSGGVRSGVNGTPTFFINGERHDGPFDFLSLSDAIRRG